MMTLPWDLWVDYHRTNGDGLTHTNVRDAAGGVTLKPGVFLVVATKKPIPPSRRWCRWTLMESCWYESCPGPRRNTCTSRAASETLTDSRPPEPPPINVAPRCCDIGRYRLMLSRPGLASGRPAPPGDTPTSSERAPWRSVGRPRCA
jgi:hypothetical protein